MKPIQQLGSIFRGASEQQSRVRRTVLLTAASGAAVTAITAGVVLGLPSGSESPPREPSPTAQPTPEAQARRATPSPRATLPERTLPRPSPSATASPAPIETELPPRIRGPALDTSVGCAQGVGKGLFGNDRFDDAVMLTFDDGPHPVNTPILLDTLREKVVKATFFVTGENAQRYPEIIQRIVAEGHELGSHSWKHDQLTQMSQARVAADLASVDAAVDAALGRDYDLHLVRPPYGAFNDETTCAIGPDRSNILWTIDSMDWEKPPGFWELTPEERNELKAQSISERIFERPDGLPAGGGAILFHDIQATTIPVIGDVIDGVREAGYDFRSTAWALNEKYGADSSASAEGETGHS